MLHLLSLMQAPPPLAKVTFQRYKEVGPQASQVALVVRNPPANVGDIRDVGSITGLGRSPGGGRGNPLQHSCLGNPMDRGAWWAIVHAVTQSQTQMKQLSIHTHPDIPGGTVDESLPASAGDMGSISAPGRFHMPQSN